MAEKKAKNVHIHHRLRVKDRFLKENGFDSFSEHNILEMLLFYAVPQKDTNELAHRLIDSFGSIREVFDADYEELIGIKGVTSNIAVLIKMVPSVSKIYFDSVNKEVECINTFKEINNYFIPKFVGVKNEMFIMVALDNRGRILKTSKISEGGSDYIDINGKELLTKVILCDASNIIIAHNHPYGFCVPSKEDHDITRKLSKVLASVGVTLIDHIIVSGDEVFSFRLNRKFDDCFDGKLKISDNRIIWN